MSGNDTSLIAELIPTFLDELSEHITELNRNLLMLENDISDDERDEVYSSLFRVAHTLKGASGMMSMRVVEDACHRFEDVLEGLRTGAVQLAPRLLDLLFELADGIEDVGVRLGESRDINDTPLHTLLPRLQAVVEQTEGDDPTQPPSDSNRVSASRRPHAQDETSAELADDTAPGVDAAVGDSVLSRRASVKIEADKLDALVARAGELIVTNDRMEARGRELDNILAFVGKWRTDWRHVHRSLGRSRLNPATAHGQPNKHQGDTIDALEQAVLSAHGCLGRLGHDLEHLAAQLSSDRSAFRQSVVPIEEEIRCFRMLPFSHACQGLDRSVRDTARVLGKQVTLVIEADNVELDRSILDSLKDPLLHLVRNAVDHGIETPEERELAGKDQTATITVSAALRGTRVEITIGDDGKGLNDGAIRDKAESRGLTAPQDPRELANLIFHPGFSTASAITQISGRGVGLDVVKSTVESLHGDIHVTSDPGSGTRFSITVPMTLTTTHVLLVGTANQVFAVLTPSVAQLIRVQPSDVQSVTGRPVLFHAGRPVPVVSLAAALGIDADDATDLRESTAAMIVSSGDQQVAFTVDELLSEQQVVIKRLERRLEHIPNVSGATILPGGEIALILNASDLIRSALSRQTFASSKPLRQTEAARKCILLADDMPTTRVLERSILESAGYEVIVAVDGREAWDKLQKEPVDLVVSDVDMPIKDGFALTQSIRDCERLRDLPVVLVTARDTEDDKARGIEVGANSYITKNSFTQGGLLNTIAQLL